MGDGIGVCVRCAVPLRRWNDRRSCSACESPLCFKCWEVFGACPAPDCNMRMGGF